MKEQETTRLINSLGFELTYTVEDSMYFSFGIYSVRVNGESGHNLILITKKRDFKQPKRKGEEIILFRGYDVFGDKEFAIKLFKKIGFFKYVEFLSNNQSIKKRHQIYFKSEETEVKTVNEI